MENQRLLLWVAMGFIGLLLYQAWVRDYAAPPASPAVTAEAPGTGSVSSPGDRPELPAEMTPTPAADAPALDAAAAPVTKVGETVLISTDVLDVRISTVGADVRNATLKTYPVKKDRPDELVVIFDDQPDSLFVVQSGFLSNTAAVPTHEAVYLAPRTSYTLADGQDSLSVPFTWRGDDGVVVTKTYTFRRGRFNIDMDYRVENNGNSLWTGADYVQIKRHHAPIKRSIFSVESISFMGPVFYDGEKYAKIKVDDLADEPLDTSVSNGWIASIQQHFLGAAIPAESTTYKYRSRVNANNVYMLSAVGPLQTLAPGASANYHTQLFAGPKLQRQLAETATGLRLTVDYGFLTIFSQPLFWVLDHIHSLVGNWGWAIILLTVLIKLVFYPLAEKSGRSMAKMRKLQPRIKAMQERYKDDRQALSRAMMDLYKKEQANPMAGCLPILVQMPVFLALYWVLLESVELRQAPFALWIQDLSSRDPFFILPALMAITMLAQQKLSPAPPDPNMARVMMLMPFMMAVFFAFFPAGLVLYWFFNTLLSVLQQWRINRVVEAQS